MNNLKVVGIAPPSAINHVLKMYDAAKPNEKIKLLIQDKTANAIISNAVPKRFASRKTIDLRAGELLSLGVIGLYYNFYGILNHKSYQVVVGIEDNMKKEIESIISDGAIWDEQSLEKMPFQQTLVQGYYPTKKLTTEDVIKAIDDKIQKRAEYPKNCGLIISLYAETGELNFQEITKKCELVAYQAVFIITYRMPLMDQAIVTLVEENMSEDKFKAGQRLMNLPRGPAGPWIVRDNPVRA
jgi:hypothetical protein